MQGSEHRKKWNLHYSATAGAGAVQRYSRGVYWDLALPPFIVPEKVNSNRPRTSVRPETKIKDLPARDLARRFHEAP